MACAIPNDPEYHAKNVQWLEFELSNNCQYSGVHSWCPRSRDKRSLTFLSSWVVKKVIDYFADYGFAGRVYFSGYSEPLIDPRLTELVRYARAKMPACDIDMFSNGVACDEHLLADVLEAGVNRIRLSVYNQEEAERLHEVVSRLGSPNVHFHPRQFGDESNGENIDDRIHVYDRPGFGLKEFCCMPVLYYFVRNNGDVNMCFTDWKYTEVFGNLYVDSVEETLIEPRRIEIISRLVDGDRAGIPVCSGCRLPGERCIQEYKHRMKL